MAINKGYLSAKTDRASDEVFTPKYAVLPLLPYLKENNYHTIWCPFDENNSNYVKIFQQAGYKVISSHLNEGYDFFTYEPVIEYDVIISNPPFSQKEGVLQRLEELDKPYAILFPLPALQAQKTFPYLKNNCQLLIFDKRIEFFKNKSMDNIQKGVSFASIYVCKNFLPKDLIFEELNKNDI